MTFLAYDDDGDAHDLPGHPEHAGRARALRAHVEASPRFRAWSRIDVDRDATDEEILRAHDPSLLAILDAAHQAAPVMIDEDTYCTTGSVRAARRAARLSILAALRAWRTGERGFVIARPPGHHATTVKPMGFCLVNNVAVAARAVLADGAQRVWILDHDVHHGNGTEDVFWDDDRVLFQSWHLAPHYPGTGPVDAIGGGTGAGFTMNAPLSPGAGDAEARAVLMRAFLPAAKRFAPDVALISAGFDSLAGDPLGGMELSAEFFGEIAARVIEVCPKVVGVLEGGYDVDAIPRALDAELRALDGDAFPTSDDMADPPCLRMLRGVHGARWGI